MKLKNILFLCMILCTSLGLKAQDSANVDNSGDVSNLSFRERLTYNIGGGLMFGTYTNINVFPQIGYRVTNNLTAGIGGTFQYFKIANSIDDPSLIYGGNSFLRLRLTENLFAQGEYQLLKYNGFWGDYALVGGGYISPNNFYISGYYILKYPTGNNNAYGVPYVLRVGYMF